MGPIRRIEGDVHATLARVNEFIDNAENGITVQVMHGEVVLPFQIRIVVDEKAAAELNPGGKTVVIPIEKIMSKLGELVGGE